MSEMLAFAHGALYPVIYFAFVRLPEEARMTLSPLAMSRVLHFPQSTEPEWGVACTYAGGQVDVRTFVAFREMLSFVDSLRDATPESAAALLEAEAFHLDTGRIVLSAEARYTVFPPEAGKFDVRWDDTGSSFTLHRRR